MNLTVYLNDVEVKHLEAVAGRRKFGHEWALHQIIEAHRRSVQVAGVDPSPTETQEEVSATTG